MPCSVGQRGRGVGGGRWAWLGSGEALSPGQKLVFLCRIQIFWTASGTVQSSGLEEGVGVSAE